MQAGGEIPLSFHRYYNSKDTGTGTMGSCFLHNYEMEVQKQPDQKAAVRMHDGQFYYFAETDTGYVAENAAMGLLERTEDGYKLTCHPGMDAVYFDKNGKAARQENTNKRGITFIRDERGRLEKAETDTGSFLEYAYDSEGMLMEVTDHAGRKVKLEYDGGMLKTVTTPSSSVHIQLRRQRKDNGDSKCKKCHGRKEQIRQPVQGDTPGVPGRRHDGL